MPFHYHPICGKARTFSSYRLKNWTVVLGDTLTWNSYGMLFWELLPIFIAGAQHHHTWYQYLVRKVSVISRKSDAPGKRKIRNRWSQGIWDTVRWYLWVEHLLLLESTEATQSKACILCGCTKCNLVIFSDGFPWYTSTPGIGDSAPRPRTRTRGGTFVTVMVPGFEKKYPNHRIGRFLTISGYHI